MSAFNQILLRKILGSYDNETQTVFGKLSITNYVVENAWKNPWESKGKPNGESRIF